MEKRNKNVLDKINDYLSEKYEKNNLDFVYLELFEDEPQMIHITYLKQKKAQNYPSKKIHASCPTTTYELVTESVFIDSIPTKIEPGYRYDFSDLNRLYGGDVKCLEQ